MKRSFDASHEEQIHKKQKYSNMDGYQRNNELYTAAINGNVADVHELINLGATIKYKANMKQVLLSPHYSVDIGRALIGHSLDLNSILDVLMHVNDCNELKMEEDPDRYNDDEPYIPHIPKNIIVDRILELMDDQHVTDKVQLYLLSERNTSEGIFRLIDRGISVNAALCTTLMSTDDRTETFVELLKRGANINALVDEETPLQHFVLWYSKERENQGDEDEPIDHTNIDQVMLARLRMILSHGADVNIVSSSEPPLFLAVVNKLPLEFISALLNAGADVNKIVSRTYSKDYVFLAAFRHSQKKQLLKMLFEKGVDINAPIDLYYYMPKTNAFGACLHQCHSHEDRDIVEYLLTLNPDKRTTSVLDDNTPVSLITRLAHEGGYHNVLDLLLKHGFDPSYKPQSQSALPLIAAVTRSTKEFDNTRKWLETVCVLLDHGIGFDENDIQDAELKNVISQIMSNNTSHEHKAQSILDAFIKDRDDKKNAEELRLFLLEPVDKQLYKWCEDGNLEMVKSLISKGANPLFVINLTTRLSCPFIAAVDSRNVPLLRYLIFEVGVNIQKANSHYTVNGKGGCSSKIWDGGIAILEDMDYGTEIKQLAKEMLADLSFKKNRLNRPVASCHSWIRGLTELGEM
jgi:ankyrin repeat protein